MRADFPSRQFAVLAGRVLLRGAFGEIGCPVGLDSTVTDRALPSLRRAMKSRSAAYLRALRLPQLRLGPARPGRRGLRAARRGATAAGGPSWVLWLPFGLWSASTMAPCSARRWWLKPRIHWC